MPPSSFKVQLWTISLLQAVINEKHVHSDQWCDQISAVYYLCMAMPDPLADTLYQHVKQVYYEGVLAFKCQWCIGSKQVCSGAASFQLFNSHNTWRLSQSFWGTGLHISLPNDNLSPQWRNTDLGWWHQTSQTPAPPPFHFLSPPQYLTEHVAKCREEITASGENIIPKYHTMYKVYSRGAEYLDNLYMSVFSNLLYNVCQYSFSNLLFSVHF